MTYSICIICFARVASFSALHTQAVNLAEAAAHHEEPDLLERKMDFDQELDARGLNCPLPILKAKKSLTGMTAGTVLKIISTDPGSVKDFEAFAKQTGNALLSSAASGSEFVFFLKKK